MFSAEAPAAMAVTPDPAEVAGVRWVALPELRAEVARRPGDFAAWLRVYLDRGAELFG